MQFDQNQPIAIVGMGCYFPGANSYEEYWKNILDNKCFIENLPDDSEVAQNYNSDIKAWNRSSTKLCARVKPFDFPFRKFKGLMPNVINMGDFYSKYSLMAAQNAVEDAGEKAFLEIKDDTFVAVGHYNYETKAVRQFSDSALRIFIDDLKQTSTFVSCSSSEQQKILDELEQNFFKGKQIVPHETIVSSMGPAVASRLTKLNHFNGGFTSVDSACASSLAALDIAVRRLRDHSSRAAVVGGIGVVSPYFYLHCSKAHTMSSEGSFPFDKKASGFVVGEGAGFIVVKTLSEALKNGDRIHAVIRGVAGSSDGVKRGPWAPNKEGQMLAVQRALNQSGYSFSEVDYVECHGTGTQVGDKEELAGLNLLLQESNSKKEIYIGSAKGAVGHLLPGAGMAGLIRTVMALKSRTLPGTVGLQTPIDELSSPESKFRILTEAKKWNSKHGQNPLRAMVNSFGFGGTNYNIQVEEFVQAYHKKYLDPDSNLFVKKIRFHVAADQFVENNYNNPIAIVGMGLNLPGSSSVEEFHQNNKEGTTFFRKVPPDRYSKKFFDGLKVIGGEKAANSMGGYVDLPDSDSKLNWRISPIEIKDIDPNQFRLLEVVKTSLSDADLLDKKDILEKTGLICGVMIDSDFFGMEHVSVRMNALVDYICKDLKILSFEKRNSLADELLKSAKPNLYEQAKDSAIAGIDSMLGSRAAKFFDLKGGSISLDAVCATGIVAIDHACRLLRSRELDAVVVCSSTMGMNVQLKQCYDQMTGGWLNEPSKPFDKDRRGFLIGEGAVSFILRRMEDAVKDGQKIYSLIRATGLSSDGSSNQMLQPHFATAKLSFLATQKQAMKDFAVEMVESHGIGTIASDQTEMELIKEHYSKNLSGPVSMGALKGSIGHLKVCSAFATIARASISVQSGTKYPTANFSNPDPFLLENQQSLRVLTKPEDYQNKERLCAVTSFGLGGINGHLILSNYDPKIHRTKQVLANTKSASSSTTVEPFKIVGSAEERGILLGILWARSFNQNYEHVWQRLPQQLFNQKEDLVGIFQKWLPEEYKEELAGLAKGADVPAELVLWANCLTMAVTTQYGLCFGFSKNGFHGSNYDFPFVTKDDNELLPREVLEFHSPGKIPFSGVFLLGSPFPYCGVNAKGISISASSGTALGRVSNGIFVYALVRMVLEAANSLEEAKKLMMSYTVSGAWIFIIQSKVENKSLFIEMSEDVFQVEEKLVSFATNHFQMFNDGLKTREDSVLRLERLGQLLATLPMQSAQDSLSILADKYDVARKKITQFSTSNTLNRYNSAVSFLFDQRADHFHVSYKNIPSGDSSYQVFALPKKSSVAGHSSTETEKSGNWKTSTPTINELIVSQVSVGERSDWRDAWENSSKSQSYFLVDNEQTSLIADLSMRYPQIPIQQIQHELIMKQAESGGISLIDLTGCKTTEPVETTFKNFKLKTRMIKEMLKRRQIIDVINISLDDSAINSGLSIVKQSAANSLSKPFYKTLRKEKVSESFWQLDLLRMLDLWGALDLLAKGKYPKFEDSILFNHQLFSKRYSVDFKLHPKSSLKTKKETILFTGGASGIGFECLKKLVLEYPLAEFVVIGRTKPQKIQEAAVGSKTAYISKLATLKPGLTPKEYLADWNSIQQAESIEKNLSKLEKMNATVFYYPCDLLNLDSVCFTIADILKKHGPVSSVVHSAGLETAKLFKDSDDYLGSTFFLKTEATVHLFNQLRDQPLQNIVLFSSIASEVGNEGQSEYAAGNGFYSYYTSILSKIFSAAIVKNILWPAWDQVGMASKAGVRALLIEKGFQLIEPEQGSALFLEIFKSTQPNSAVIVSHKKENFLFHDFSYKFKKLILSELPTFKVESESMVDRVSVALENHLVFEKVFSGEERFLKDHIVKQNRAVPGVFWIEMLMESTKYSPWHEGQSISVDQIEFVELCNFRPQQARKVQLILDRESSQKFKFRIQSDKKNSNGDLLAMATVHAYGLVSLREKSNSKKVARSELCEKLGAELYKNLNSVFDGHLGPLFHLVKNYHQDKDKTVLSLEMKSTVHWGLVFDTLNQAAFLWGDLGQPFHFLPQAMTHVWINMDMAIPKTATVILKKGAMERDRIFFQAQLVDECGILIADFGSVVHKQFGNKNSIREISL